MPSQPKRESHFQISSHLPAELWIILVLTATVFCVYQQVIDYPFIRYDDGLYITENKQVQAGLNFSNIRWAFTTIHASNWHPLTWLSHMLDISLFGMNPGAHHMVNVGLHMANSVLLFVVLRTLSGTVWQSGLVAAFFALHPLHVESVAWIAERKDVLSAFFCLLAILCYGRYVKRLSPSWYLLAIIFFVLGVLAKPMIVSLPFLLLLLDYWPLGRLKFIGSFRSLNSHEKNSFSRLILEKLPFLFIAIISCIVTYYAQQRGGALGTFEEFSLGTRIANAIASYSTYIGKAFWPASLSPFYPHPKVLPAWQVAVAGAWIICIFGIAVITIKQLPYLFAGWLWYFGTLVPVIGLVQVGEQAMADRYMYIPLIGIYIIVVWGMADLLAKWPHRKPGFILISAIIISVLMMLTWKQIQIWSSNLTFFNRWIKTAPASPTAHYNLGVEYAQINKVKEAIQHYSEAIQIKPDYVNARNNLANELIKQGRLSEAFDHYSYALQLDPNDPELHNNFGVVLFQSGGRKKAIDHFKTALRIKPDYAVAEQNLEKALSPSKNGIRRYD